jgi:hypothetical protein
VSEAAIAGEHVAGVQAAASLDRHDLGQLEETAKTRSPEPTRTVRKKIMAIGDLSQLVNTGLALLNQYAGQFLTILGL